MRTVRLFALLDHLRGRSIPVAAESLARDLDVSVRTIYRDMATLQALGVPLRGAAGLGYLLERGAFLPPMRFDGDELDAVMLGLQWAGRRGDPALAGAALRVLAKLRASLPGDDGERLLERPIRPIGVEAPMSDDDSKHFALLRAALRDREVVQIGYRRAGAESGLRYVRPLGLFAFGPIWLVTAWCELRADFRHFRLDPATLAGRRFRHERGKRLEDALARLG
jgi:predicted DNA-binding transcriptional regulator YafY